MNTYFTSDLHLGHENIIKYCSRPFKSLKIMDETIIRNWNSRVKPDDLVFHIGDFCFSKSTEAQSSIKKPFNYYRSLLNGNIIFIQGNHDKSNTVKSCIQKIVIEYASKRINLVHNPEHADFRYDINLVGHVHNNWKILRKTFQESFTDCINIGCDVWNYYPVTWGEIDSRYQNFLKNNC